MGMISSAAPLALAALVACAPHISRAAPAADAAPGPSSAPPLRLAFPKAYNKLETWQLYGGFVRHLAQCTRLRIVNQDGRALDDSVDALDLLPEDRMLELLKQGKLQLTQVSTGLVPAAMDSAKGVPFAVRGDGASGRFHGYRVNLIVRADSPFKVPADLQGKRIAHTTAGSNSGNLAPRAYFPAIGLVPETGYQVVFSQGHERSIIGTQYGFWDAAAVASDQFERMARKGQIRRSDFRVLWSSDTFPASAWVMSGQLPSETQATLRRCTASYRIPANVSALLDGADRFVAIDPVAAYAPVRFVAERSAPTKH
jgi:ABC-type phosphate/phosphonate transport system substrate-binding protein